MAKRERFKWLKGLTLTLQILFWGITALEALALAVWLFGATATSANRYTYLGLGAIPAFLGFALHIATIPVLPAWTGVAAAARPYKAGDNTRLWAWLGYLIPAVSYVAPVLVLRAVAREAAPSNSGMRVLALLFWLARLTTSVAGVFVVALISMLVTRDGPENNASVLFGIIASCLCAGSFLGARLVTGLSRAVVAHTTGAEQADVF